ncbi:F-box protein At4g02733-like isoform X2 [Punica granatum]|uniref:F-box protein At4g02733-like isoform X2 n=1 Tax=Punica granatum TaxID=22663 RepID=A0A6P8E1Y5_PUNGR|nr:F-box protein At4g02733-like isoform X2 [Punica granatum]
MDTLLFHCPPSPPPPSSMANKRPCPSSSSSSSSSPHSPCRLSPLDQIDNLFDTFLSLSDSSPHSIDLSFDRLLDSRPSDADQSLLIDQALRLGSAVLEAAKRSARKRASKHNSLSWVLPPDLTIKVFSMLDTQSLCYAAATCSMFNKCAMDPLCYTNIDLTTVVPKVNNAVVSTMIQRAGKAMRSLKLGLVPGPASSPGPCQQLVYTIRNSVDVSNFSWNDKKTRQGKESPILTRTCLSPLICDGGSVGTLLRRLHLYNIDRMDSVSLCMALSACPALCDLEIVGLHVELRQILSSVSKYCHLIERLFLESSKTGRDDSLKSPTCVDLVNSCPHLTSLSLRGFKLHDCKVRTLVKGFRKLRYIDFSTSYSITGNFLRNIGSTPSGNLLELEVLILRDCMHLKEDISNREGLALEGDWYNRCYSATALPLREVALERPDICLLAEFPSESFIDVEQMIESDLNTELSLPSQLNGHLSDSSIFISSSESSYHSDHGSGNEDSHDSNYILYEESSDEVDFLAV